MQRPVRKKLKIPERSEDGEKIVEEVMDELDIEIVVRSKKHEKDMSGVDAEKTFFEKRYERIKKNPTNSNRDGACTEKNVC